MKPLIAVLLFAVASLASAFQPRAGIWANLNEPGSGYAIEVQEGVLVITIYSYEQSGVAQWYLAAGPMTNGQHTFNGTLDKYVGGQCISCAYRNPGGPVGNDGTISIFFTSETTATLTLPGGRITQIQSLNFATGDPPTGLLGQWVLFYDVGATTFANRFDFSTTQASTDPSLGTFALDLGRRAGCALALSGAVQGLVICVVLDPQNNLSNGYVFRFGLDQTYDGLWISADGNTTYPMKGFKVKTRGGFVNQAAAGTMQDADDPAMRRTAQGVASAPVMQWGAAAQRLAEAIGRVTRTP